jgi:flagellin
MGMYVNTNTAANNAYRNLNNNQTALNKSLEKLSSGLRINRAADDAAGLAISEGMKSQVGGLGVAATNAQDGINLIQTAEGGLSQAQSILQRLRDLSVQAANDSNNTDSRNAIKTEATSLVAELGRISGSTNFGGKPLLDGSAGTLNFQVGANGNTASQIGINLTGANVDAISKTLAGGNLGATGSAFAIAAVGSLTTAAATFTSTTAGGVTTTINTAVLKDTADGSAAGFQSVDEYANALKADANFSANFNVTVSRDANGAGTGIVVSAINGGTVSTTAAPAAGVASGGSTGTALTGGLNFDTAANAQASISMLDTQITSISTARATMGATQNRLESAIQTINIAKENLSSASSRITDTDMASEMVNYTRSSILSQAGTAMLAQANQSNQGVLKLLQ